MGVQRYVLRSGAVRYRARVKFHGREVATRVFERRADAIAWEQDQRRRLRLGEWTDPRRGRVPLGCTRRTACSRFWATTRATARPAFW
jgi:hypothetical protein